ncbi:MAG: hypothetical protein ACI9XC_000604 [Gammaproteobacteria bacterium]|jgi:hypothetical protein
MIKTKRILIITALLIVFVSSLFAKGIYQEPNDFLIEVFTGDIPQVKKLWLEKDLKEDVRNILGHDLGVLRLSYWQRDNRTAWILEEIGKSLPITVGIVVNENKIERIKILIFRESRGWEVRYPFFTEQFTSAILTSGNKLDKGIDGISGATLSVNAVKKLAALALLFHQQLSK